MESTRLYPNLVFAACGRSGTGHVAAILDRLGYTCGHERAIRPQGFMGFGDLVAEASWFAGPYVADLPESTLVIHQVRNPASVIASFYRIGFFDDGPWRSVLVNPRRTASYVAHPSRLPRRLRELKAQRGLVKATTSVFDERDVLVRCYRYWFEWNALIERELAAAGRPHELLRLESLDPKAVHSLLQRVDRPSPTLREVEHVVQSLPPSNQMPEYRERPLRWRPPTAVPGLEELAAAYGYESAFSDLPR